VVGFSKVMGEDICNVLGPDLAPLQADNKLTPFIPVALTVRDATSAP
jgi:hypothetical protein